MIPSAGKKAAVLGIGVSGFAGAVFLAEKGYDVFVSDQGNSESIRQKAEILRKKNIEVETGGHTLQRLLSSDWVMISPGIPPAAPAVKVLREKKIPVYNEIEVASWFNPARNVISVTGSSGKTTVTTLLGMVFEKWKGRSFVCGNIGNPWISEISKIKADDFVVVEVSSFQLHYCETFRPRVGLLLNLSQNHQDWHPDMEDYAKAKLRLFQAQKAEDVAIIRKADQKAYFPDYAFPGEVQYIDEPPAALKTDNPNETAVRMTAAVFGCPQAIVDEVLKSFQGIEHRLEKTAQADGVQYINDSKCTTTASLKWALEKFPDGRVILIAGGHPKSNDFESIKVLVKRKVKKAVLIGEARPLLRAAWQDSCTFWETDDFKAAVLKAREFAAAGDTVLLSPACASFDMFQNYMERGTLFKTIVKEITGNAAVKV